MYAKSLVFSNLLHKWTKISGTDWIMYKYKLRVAFKTLKLSRIAIDIFSILQGCHQDPEARLKRQGESRLSDGSEYNGAIWASQRYIPSGEILDQLICSYGQFVLVLGRTHLEVYTSIAVLVENSEDLIYENLNKIHPKCFTWCCYTACIRSLATFYIVCYDTKWAKTSCQRAPSSWQARFQGRPFGRPARCLGLTIGASGEQLNARSGCRSADRFRTARPLWHQSDLSSTERAGSPLGGLRGWQPAQGALHAPIAPIKCSGMYWYHFLF